MAELGGTWFQKMACVSFGCGRDRNNRKVRIKTSKKWFERKLNKIQKFGIEMRYLDIKPPPLVRGWCPTGGRRGFGARGLFESEVY